MAMCCNAYLFRITSEIVRHLMIKQFNGFSLEGSDLIISKPNVSRVSKVELAKLNSAVRQLKHTSPQPIMQESYF